MTSDHLKLFKKNIINLGCEAESSQLYEPPGGYIYVPGPQDQNSIQTFNFFYF